MIQIPMTASTQQQTSVKMGKMEILIMSNKLQSCSYQHFCNSSTVNYVNSISWF